MIGDFDVNGSGDLCLEGFSNMLKSPLSDKDVKIDMNREFEFNHNNQQGKISCKNLRRLAIALGDTKTDEELVVMIENANPN